jgi:hypothetical protein
LIKETAFQLTLTTTLLDIFAHVRDLSHRQRCVFFLSLNKKGAAKARECALQTPATGSRSSSSRSINSGDDDDDDDPPDSDNQVNAPLEQRTRKQQPIRFAAHLVIFDKTSLLVFITCPC